jgi:purine-cytosine permease-like protein
MGQLPLLLFGLCFFSPVIAVVCAGFFYVRHRRACPLEKRISVIAYVFALLVCALVGYLIGLQYGIVWACSPPIRGGNLCGLAGFFVIGPLAAALATFFAGGSIVFLRGSGR